MQRIAIVMLFIAAGLLLGSLATGDEPQGGTLTGILTAKGENWIAVRADGAAESVKYWPFWRGG
ncbi:MAG: hypothetical protein ABFD96_13930, partial [Armatimonadia bacterium]